jgi:hypothetical protein
MLQEDLLRLPSFPRSAIDAEFSLFSDPQGTKQERSLPSLGFISNPYFVLTWRALYEQIVLEASGFQT